MAAPGSYEWQLLAPTPNRRYFRPMRDLPVAGRLLIQYASGYLRSTQLLPMIIAWAGVWGVLAAFAVVNFQQQGLSVLTALQAIGQQLSWLPSPGPIGSVQPDGSFTLSGEDIRKVVLTYWGVLSAALYIITSLVARVRGPQPPMALRAQTRIAALLGVLTFAAFFTLYVVSDQPFEGSTATWTMIFLALSIVPVFVSLYSLTVVRLIDRIGDALLGVS